MKFSYRQILASAAGAVIAALIASSFGVTGTIVGVAIGSMAATMGTALVSQSIERGHKVVKQAVVRVPEVLPSSTLLRRVGGTRTAGRAASSVDGGPSEPDPTEASGAVGEETVEVATTAPPLSGEDAARHRETAAAERVGRGASVPETVEATTVPLPRTATLEGAGVVGVSGGAGVASTAGSAGEARWRRFTWKAFAGTAAIVFVLALGFVTAVELIANRPTVFTPASPGTPTPTTSTPSTTSTSTSATTSSTTTSTTAPSSTSTSTTAPGTTTTNILKQTTTTTAVPAGP